MTLYCREVPTSQLNSTKSLQDLLRVYAASVTKEGAKLQLTPESPVIKEGLRIFQDESNYTFAKSCVDSSIGISANSNTLFGEASKALRLLDGLKKGGITVGEIGSLQGSEKALALNYLGLLHYSTDLFVDGRSREDHHNSDVYFKDVSCGECHLDAKKYPKVVFESELLKMIATERCSSCHSPQKTEGGALNPGGACQSCHGKHSFDEKNPLPPKGHEEKWCTNCHGKKDNSPSTPPTDETTVSYGSPVPKNSSAPDAPDLSWWKIAFLLTMGTAGGLVGGAFFGGRWGNRWLANRRLHKESLRKDRELAKLSELIGVPLRAHAYENFVEDHNLDTDPAKKGKWAEEAAERVRMRQVVPDWERLAERLEELSQNKKIPAIERDAVARDLVHNYVTGNRNVPIDRLIKFHSADRQIDRIMDGAKAWLKENIWIHPHRKRIKNEAKAELDNQLQSIVENYDGLDPDVREQLKDRIIRQWRGRQGIMGSPEYHEGATVIHPSIIYETISDFQSNHPKGESVHVNYDVEPYLLEQHAERLLKAEVDDYDGLTTKEKMKLKDHVLNRWNYPELYEVEGDRFDRDFVHRAAETFEHEKANFRLRSQSRALRLVRRRILFRRGL